MISLDNLTFKPLVFLEKKCRTLFPKEPKFRLKMPKAESVLFLLLSFLLGRTSLLSSLHPLGGAFFASAFSGGGSFVYAAATLGGMAIGGASLSSIGKYIFAMCLFALIFEKFASRNEGKILVRSALFSASLALSGIFFIISVGSSFGGGETVLFYDLLTLFVETAAAFIASCAFSEALPTVKRMQLCRTLSSAEEISLVLLFGGAVSGARDISSIGAFNIADIVCVLMVLVFSIRLGAARGAVAGLVMGLVAALGEGTLGVSCISFAFSGLAAGLCGFYGAIPGCSAFIIANALGTAFANGSTEVLISIYDIFAACLLYSITPEKLLQRVTGFGARDETQRAAQDEKDFSLAVFKSASDFFSVLEGRLNVLDKTISEKHPEEIKLFERTARRACGTCGMRRMCWNRDVQGTFNLLRKALSEYWDGGEIRPEMLPKNCMHPKEFTEVFLQMSELYRTDLIWAEKLSEQRRAARGQLKAFLSVLSACEGKVRQSGSFDRALADDISRRMGEAEVISRNVSVMLDSDGDPIVTLTLENCGGFALCENAAAEIVSAACGRKMIRAGRRDCKNCRVKYVPAPPVSLSFAASGRARAKGTSGDTALFRVIDKSLYAAVLCDGMGSGKNAARESSLAAETLLDLIELGLDGEQAMHAVSTFFLPPGEVCFTAADLWLYDAVRGEARVIKCGGAAAFSKSGERVDAMYSKTMPLGATLTGGVESFTFPARGGDLLVMITDGVLDSAAEGAAKDGWLIREMEKFRGDDPKRLCDIIVDKAMQRCGSDPRDDITVLAAYIE